MTMIPVRRYSQRPARRELEIRSTDVAGNVEAWGSVTVTVTEPEPEPCPDADGRPTVIIGGVDSGVPNRVDDDGCGIADHIDDDEQWTSAGTFVRHVSQVAAALMRDGTIDGRERGQLVRAASRSGIGRPTSRR